MADKLVTKEADKLFMRAETYKSGSFVFSGRYDRGKIGPLVLEAHLRHQMVSELPILPDLASSLHQDLIRRSIFGTAAIEGNPLSEERVGEIISQGDVAQARERAEREIQNLKRAYDELRAVSPAGSDLRLEESDIKRWHAVITGGIPHEHNIPGQYRRNRVQVGDADHGGVYTPPKIHEDIARVMEAFATRINSADVVSLGPHVRAGLSHYYLGLIHPFADGNGRTARFVEALMLQAAGISYVPAMLSNYYYRHIDDYFWAFSITRKNKEHDVTHFLEFMLKGVTESLEETKEGILYFIRKFSLRDYYHFLSSQGSLKKRRRDLLNLLLDRPEPFSLAELFAKPPFQILYRVVSERTARRDLKDLCNQKLLMCKKDEYSINLRALG